MKEILGSPLSQRLLLTTFFGGFSELSWVFEWFFIERFRVPFSDSVYLPYVLEKTIVSLSIILERGLRIRHRSF